MPNSRGGRVRPPFDIEPPYQSIKWGARRLWVLDQRQLPNRKQYLSLDDIPTACHAIRTLAVRGAPLIGVAAALAVANSARKGASCKRLLASIDKLSQTRPTAVNLFVTLERMKVAIESGASTSDIVTEGLAVWEEERKHSWSMAEHGQSLVKKGMKLATYCNTGALAAPGLGTALGVIVKAHLDGKNIQVVVPETRPLLQGARLTAWELTQWKVPFELVTESALATVIKDVDACFVGADRIAANGDTANKVGTHGLAVLAKHFGAQFYVVAPTSTVDLSCEHGADIPVEFRKADEVRRFRSCRSAPRNSQVVNPAFDVTPAALISAVISEKGVVNPPFIGNLK